MRLSQDILSILRLPGISMVYCKSLATMAALTPRWVKIYFCPSTYWRGAVVINILGDAALTITLPRRDVSLVGLY